MISYDVLPKQNCPHCHVAHVGPCDGVAAQLARYKATRAAGLVWPPAHRMWEYKKDEPMEQNDDN